LTELEKDGCYVRRFSMGEHSGTHLNAPNSFHPGGASIDTYTAESLVVPAIVMDARSQAAANPDYTLSVADILAWERCYHSIPPGTVLIMYTDWQARWHNPAAFFGRDHRGSLHFPGFGVDAVRFLLEERSVAGVGIDTHGVDPGQDATFATNRLLALHRPASLRQPCLVLENLTNLDQLPSTGTTLVIGILRLKGGTGSPVSVLAFVP
jgi:kynurenine formamidase